MEVNITEITDLKIISKDEKKLDSFACLSQLLPLQARHTLCTHICNFWWHSQVLEVDDNLSG